ncbi:type II toxin-antitoxin system PemK/MazF family toxin [Spirosoma arcticum]
MNEGDIIICPIASVTGSAKVRPALVLRSLPTYSDFLTCGISSQLWQEISGFDEVLTPDRSNNLRTSSVIRLSFLAVVKPSDVRGVIGRVPDSVLNTLRRRLADHLTKTL